MLAAEMAAANADVGVATAELYPRIDLGGFLGFVALRADFGNAPAAPSACRPASATGAAPTALARKRAAGLRGEVARYETVLRAVEWRPP